jgi:hypothetical protein
MQRICRNSRGNAPHITLCNITQRNVKQQSIAQHNVIQDNITQHKTIQTGDSDAKDPP